jgi:hypothetical protein
MSIEIRNSNEVRLKLLCEDILNHKVKRSTIKSRAKNYLVILKNESKENKSYEGTLEKTI